MIGSRFVYAKIFDEIGDFRVICGSLICNYLKQLRGFISSQDFVSKKGEGLTSCLELGRRWCSPMLR